MSTPQSAVRVAVRKKAPHRPMRSPSASEIAHNLNYFETWSAHQRCEQASYADLPDDMKKDVANVFDTSARLPMAWVDKSSKEFRILNATAPQGAISFVRDAFEACPSLFSDQVSCKDIPEVFVDLAIVFSAWKRLQRMRVSKEKWSEADYVANVYNVFRSPAIQESAQRVHCTIAMPQPFHRSSLSSEAIRILNSKTVIPDSAIFLPAASVHSLSHSSKSPFKVIKSHASVANTGSASKGSSFRFQSTPCAQLPESPGFEFISCFWEDKKPLHKLLDDAYRQNRIASASAVRHLHSLSIQAPVFGLVWSEATVRAHIDWAKSDDTNPTVLSAPYPGTGNDSGLFHEWTLDRPSDLLKVYFMVKNIDRWTMGPFRDRVLKGIHDLTDGIVKRKRKYEPWKRVGDFGPSGSASMVKENINISITTEASPPPPKPKARSRRARRY